MTTTAATDTSLRTAALVAGGSIVLMTIAAVYATDVVPSRLFIPGDAGATFANITDSELLFRSGIISWLTILICDVLAAWGFYVVLKPVNPSLSLLGAWFRLVYSAILGMALMTFILVLPLVTGGSDLAGLGFDQISELAQWLIDGSDPVWSAGLVVFGLHILILGYLAFKSGYVPKVLGILLLIAGFGYILAHVSALLLGSDSEFKTIVDWIFIAPMVIGEVGLGIWLLVKGVRGKIE